MARRRKQTLSSSDPKLWIKEISSLWQQWMPNSSSAIWKLLGISALMTGLDTSPKLDLILSQTGIESFHLWTIFTTGLVLRPQSPLFVLLLLGFIAAFKSGALQGSVRKPRYFAYAFGIFVILSIISTIFPPGMLWSLITEGLTLVWFGKDIERRWGSRRFLKICIAVLSLSYLVAGLYLFLFGGPDMHGLHPISRGLILVWGYYLGSTHLAFLNIKAVQIRWVVYAFCGFELLLQPLPFGLVPLAAAFILEQYIRGRLPLFNVKWMK